MNPPRAEVHEALRAPVDEALFAKVLAQAMSSSVLAACRRGVGLAAYGRDGARKVGSRATGGGETDTVFPPRGSDKEETLTVPPLV